MKKGTFFDVKESTKLNSYYTLNHSQNEVTIPASYIDELMTISNEISFQKEQELLFIKSCLYYLKEGVGSEHAINMAMVDYLTEL